MIHIIQQKLVYDAEDKEHLSILLYDDVANTFQWVIPTWLGEKKEL